MIIKVCGMRETSNIQEVENLGVDWMGFIFYEKSKRFVSVRPEYLPIKVKRIGVFVDCTIENILTKMEEFQLDGIQLHGSESPEYCQELRRRINRPILINKAFGIRTIDDLKQIDAYEGLCNYYLFDTKTESKGGSGQSFDWSILTHYQGETPFLLSGGIGLENEEELKSFHHKQLAGVDLNSKFEISPALKDTNKLDLFLKNFNRYE